MSVKTRQDKIIEILEKEGYVTVRYLSEALRYSTATVNRDLNALEAKQLVTRSHGGVELSRSVYVPVFFRSHKMRAEKMHISKAAASFVKDGETIFIDGSTTAQCMEKYLLSRKDLTVVTNNIALAASLSTHGIRVISLGGEIVEAPSMVGGPEAVEHASKYRVDRMFFASCAITSDGLIASGVFDLMLKAIAKNAKEVYYLVDHKKIDQPFHKVFCDFSAVDCVVSDYDFPEKTKAAFSETRFITVDE
jgi:DeoR/GlpR family transcriptional regulator of sugar metabolism